VFTINTVQYIRLTLTVSSENVMPVDSTCLYFSDAGFWVDGNLLDGIGSGASALTDLGANDTLQPGQSGRTQQRVFSYRRFLYSGGRPGTLTARMTGSSDVQCSAWPNIHLPANR